MMDRTAVDTIRGYLYQFDYSIETLLELKNDADTIVVEGIEDIDVSTPTDETAIQCKYYSKTEYNHSVIAQPVRFMLSHFKKAKDEAIPHIKYILYGCFKSGQTKLNLPINLAFLKNSLLTYTKEKVEHYHYIELGLNDEDLTEFLSLLSININAKDYNAQLESILSLLKQEFNCSDFEAENFFYNNALKVIKDISVEKEISNRQISRREFVNKINTQQILFHSWFLQYKGKQKLLRDLRAQYFTNLNTSPFERFFLIEIPIINSTF